MPISLTEDKTKHNRVTVVETRAVILNDSANLEKLSKKDETKGGNYHRNTRCERASWEACLPIKIQRMQRFTIQVKKSLQNKKPSCNQIVGWDCCLVCVI